MAEGAFGWFVGREVEFDQASEGDSEVDPSGAAVGHNGNADWDGVIGADQVNGLLDAAALGDDIFGNEDAFPWLQREAAAEVEVDCSSFSAKMALTPRLRPTSWPTTMPPMAGEMTVSMFWPSHALAMAAQSLAAMTVCCKTSAA